MNKYNIIDFIFTVEELFLFNVLYGKNSQNTSFGIRFRSLFIYVARIS